MSEIERTRKALHEAEETIEQLRGLLREMDELLCDIWDANYSNEASPLGKRMTDVLTRVRKELGE